MLHSLTREKLLLPIPGPLLLPAILATSILGSLLPLGKLRSISITPVLAYPVAAVLANPTGDLAHHAFLPIQATVLFTQWVSFYLLHTSEKEFFRA
jgi:hypothetical protein